MSKSTPRPYAGHTPQTLGSEAIQIAKRDIFKLPIAQHKARPHVVLHWLAHMLGLPVRELEQAAQQWANEHGHPIAQVWLAGFTDGPVPCLARQHLLPMLQEALPSPNERTLALLGALGVEPVQVEVR